MVMMGESTNTARQGQSVYTYVRIYTRATIHVCVCRDVLPCRAVPSLRRGF